ncbi:hypothetical protein J6590_045833 [Homalodisca vitripennis]|nr:hypothetical protein J6590_045833 [Homalodisca vitripennis]
MIENDIESSFLESLEGIKGPLDFESNNGRKRKMDVYGKNAKLVTTNVAESVECKMDFKEKRLKNRKLFHDETRDASSTGCVQEHSVKHEEKIFRINVFYQAS